MKTVHWYAGIILLTLALLVHALLYDSSSRYHCVSSTQRGEVSLCVDSRSGSAEFVTASEKGFVAMRWRVGTGESATVHSLALVKATEKK